MENQKNIPQLRFPYFAGEWEKKKLGEVSSGVMYGMNAAAKEYDGVHKYIRITDIDENSREFCPNPLSSPDEKPDKRYKLKAGDIVFARTGASVGKSYLYKEEDGDIYFAGFLIRFTINKAIPFFVYTQTLLRPYDKWVKIMSMRSGQPGVNAEEFKTLNLSFPTLPEQQKIASFFTAIDQKISQLKRKRTLLEQYKKGVMQKIFSQQIRFKDDNGQKFPKWEKRKLGDVGKTYNGLTGKSKDDFGQGKPYIQYKQIFDDTRIDITRFDFVRIRDGEKQCHVSYGDVFFTTSSETPDEVGTSSVLLDEVSELYLNSFCFGYRSSQDVLMPQFSRYLFRNELLRKEINKLAQGSTRYNISKNELMKKVIELPIIQEQTKIANFLSAIDDKIIHTQKQIEKSEVWKKGLMQQMFC